MVEVVEFERKPFVNKKSGSVLVTIPKALVDAGKIAPGVAYRFSLVAIATNRVEQDSQGATVGPNGE